MDRSQTCTIVGTLSRQMHKYVENRQVCPPSHPHPVTRQHQNSSGWLLRGCLMVWKISLRSLHGFLFYTCMTLNTPVYLAIFFFGAFFSWPTAKMSEQSLMDSSIYAHVYSFEDSRNKIEYSDCLFSWKTAIKYIFLTKIFCTMERLK